jgi:hypothetical protein
VTPPDDSRESRGETRNWTPFAGTSRLRARALDDGMLTQLVRARRLGPRAVDAVRQDIERDSRLGIGYLGIGAVVVGMILIGRGLVSFGWTWTLNDLRILSVVAWLVLIVTFAAMAVVARRNRGVLPLPVFLAVLGGDAVALALDYVALFNSDASSNYLTVSIGVGATLLACVTFRPVFQILLAVIGLGVASLVSIVVLAIVSPGSEDYGVSQLVLSLAPALAGIIVVRSFGGLVQRELDRTVAESLITAPRYGLGLLASTELTRLDLAAEELLQNVAIGRATLPLDRTLSSTASTLATDLRRVLIAGRRESWLKHAITESSYLEPVVTLTDAEGLAGYLGPTQRDGLLSAIWLIVDDSGRASPTIALDIGRPAASSGSRPDDRMVLPIAVTIGGLPRRRIEPAVWSAFSRVGQYSVESRSGRLRVRVDAHVVVPDAAR